MKATWKRCRRSAVARWRWPDHLQPGIQISVRADVAIFLSALAPAMMRENNHFSFELLRPRPNKFSFKEAFNANN